MRVFKRTAAFCELFLIDYASLLLVCLIFQVAQGNSLNSRFPIANFLSEYSFVALSVRLSLSNPMI